MTEQKGAESTRPKNGEILIEQFIACIARVVSGAVVILIAYFVVEDYRQKAACDNTYLERRLERLGTLWTATDRHGAEVLKLLSEDKVDLKDLEALGETYYMELASAGLLTAPGSQGNGGNGGQSYFLAGPSEPGRVGRGPALTICVECRRAVC